MKIAGFLVGAIRKAFNEREFLTLIGTAIATELRNSTTFNSAVAELNRKIDKVDGLLNDGSPTIYFGRRLVMAKLEEIATQNPIVAQAMSYGERYYEVVLDGITPEEIFRTSLPIGELILQRAVEKARMVVES